MFDADSAKQLVQKHFREGGEASKEWMDKMITTAMGKVANFAGENGDTSYDVVVEAHHEKFPKVKRKMLVDAFESMGFKVSVRDGSRMDGALPRLLYVITIDWS